MSKTSSAQLQFEAYDDEPPHATLTIKLHHPATVEYILKHVVCARDDDPDMAIDLLIWRALKAYDPTFAHVEPKDA